MGPGPLRRFHDRFGLSESDGPARPPAGPAAPEEAADGSRDKEYSAAR